MWTEFLLHVGSYFNSLHASFHLIYTRKQPYEMGMIVLTTLRLREVEALAQGHRMT